MQVENRRILVDEWLNYVEGFVNEFDYPEGACVSLLGDLRRVISDDRAFGLFAGYDRLYGEDVHLDYKGILKELEGLSSDCGVHRFALHLLFYIVISRRTKEIYVERGISLEIFRCSMNDLRCKLLECYNLYGVWGTCVGWWQDWFFEMRRFGLGRFQYELVPFPDTYGKNGVCLKPGDMVVNVHIPSSGPLKREECLASYDMAADFFRESLDGNPVVFFCESWMLFPEHPKFLPGTSHILEFMEDYDIYKMEYNNGDLWRIFNREYDGNPDSLPENTGLQRAYKKWLMEGHQAGLGFGVFVYKGQEQDITIRRQERKS